MGVDLVEIKYKTLIGCLSETEIEFIEEYFPRADEGTFFIQTGDSNYTLERIITRAKADGRFDEEKLDEIVKIVKKKMGRKKDTVNFTVG
ncbi:MAG: hypothetical protein HYZ34_06565 [Ignavibacteriae bacterium]|nr:hypothetical protein [Ignavibacteriota bacterium]